MVLQCVQKPHPPLWYGLGNPESAVWAAAVAANVISLRPAQLARVAMQRYRQEWESLGRSEHELPFMGVCRHVVVAETDAAALKAAAQRLSALARLAGGAVGAARHAAALCRTAAMG